jgi:hypothetical protein
MIHGAQLNAQLTEDQFFIAMISAIEKPFQYLMDQRLRLDYITMFRP